MATLHRPGIPVPLTVARGGTGLDAGAVDTAPYFSAIDQMALMTVTPLARSLLDDTTTTQMQATLGVTALPPGPPRSLLRYAADGLSAESGPTLLDVSGNLTLGTSAPGTSAVRNLVVQSGTAPAAAHPADAVQMWVADRIGIAGKAALYLRTEDNVSHIFGDLVGIGTLTPGHRFQVALSETPPTAINTILAEYGSTLTANQTLNKVGVNATVGVNLAGFTLSGTPAVEAFRGTVLVTGAGTLAQTMVVRSYINNSGAGTLTNVSSYAMVTNNSGGGVITNLNAYHVPSNVAAVATNFYGFRGEVVLAAAKWNLYMDGTAQNYLRGNLMLGTLLSGTSLDRGLVIGNGTAPTTSPADAVQLWSADRAATAGKASLHIRTEDGTSHVLGDLMGIGTVTPGYGLHVATNAGIPGGVWVNSTSRAALKQRIRPLGNALPLIRRLLPRLWEWADTEPDLDTLMPGTQAGFVVEEVAQLAASWAPRDPAGQRGLAMRGLDAYLVRALQQVLEVADTLEARVAALEAVAHPIS